MSTVLSFVGTGDYDETTYVLDGATCRTRFVAEALQAFFEPDELLLVMTPEATDAHGEQLSACCDYTPVPIPTGTAEVEWWQVFNAITEAVPEGARLVVDVTHGFRSQPFLTLAVVLYLRAVKDVRVEQIVYGAYEARDTAANRTPLFDLTPFLDLVDWSVATRQFQAYGDARPLRDMFRSIVNESRAGDRIALHLNPAGKKLGRLTRALAMNRPIEAIEESDGLIDVLEEAMDDAMNVPQARPIRRLMVAFAERFAPLGHAGGTVFTDRGFKAQAAILRFYLATEQYVQALTLAQELIVSWVCREYELDPLARYGRKEAGEKLHEWEKAYRNRRGEAMSNRERQVVRLWEGLRTLRNDIAHAGIQYDPTPAKELVQKAEKLIPEVAAFFE